MSDIELVEAVKSGNKDSVKELLDSGADLSQQDNNGWTALNWAAGKGNLEMVELLLQHGADPFAVGRDLRTPSMIALAAGRVDVFKLLRRTEEQLKGPDAVKSDRKYCAAYYLRELLRYPGWTANKLDTNETGAGQAAQESQAEEQLSDDAVVFIHQDYSVTKSMWPGEDVIFNDVTEQWKEFCTTELQFAIPDSLDLIAPHVGASSQANA